MNILSQSVRTMYRVLFNLSYKIISFLIANIVQRNVRNVAILSCS